ncbi:DUF6786 family protein [Dyadobacter luticola]|uniref:Lipoprotein n=1 Tax=Dyadobacter luticola TaxID=1979387 RepID=A0A5R9KWP7_9BACT|nr:DUF6786 family protein [Dyadobacter luticola]TLV00716.1 hypothetical protein FEN17_14630 [Dyadobacter luticola]
MKGLIIFGICLAIFGCQGSNKSEQNQVKDTTAASAGTFGYDIAFLKKHKKIILLTAPDDPASQAIIIPDYQGRVMTSTASGDGGNSYGWINYKLIESGKLQPHINAFGGEERFWLSPEGGQFSVYFKKGDKFDFEHWQTPAVIDSEAFEVVSSDSSSVVFQKKTTLENHSGTPLDFTIDRKISMLGRRDIEKALAISLDQKVKVTAYVSENTITNNGADWKRESGAIGIWLLGMFTPGAETTIIAPFSKEHSEKPQLTDNYFGEIPKERLVVKDGAVYLKADGKFRSKIGLAPLSAKPFAGSYDAEKNILTIIQYDLDPKGEYLKSTWEEHKEPFKGDALNAYNDGPLADGSQMGPFYELESNSPAKLLKKNEKLNHNQRTYHFEGDKQALNQIAQKVLGVNIDQIGEIFK